MTDEKQPVTGDVNAQATAPEAQASGVKINQPTSAAEDAAKAKKENEKFELSVAEMLQRLYRQVQPYPVQFSHHLAFIFPDARVTKFSEVAPTVAGEAPKQSDIPDEVELKDLAEATLTVTRDEVRTPSDIKIETAWSIAAAIYANPAAHEYGITLFGTERDQVMLAFALEQSDIQIANMPAPEVMEKYRAEWDAEISKLSQEAQKDAPEAEEPAAPATPLAREFEKRSRKEPLISTELYESAVEKITSMAKTAKENGLDTQITVRQIANLFNIGDEKARTLLNKIEEHEGIIERQGQLRFVKLPKATEPQENPAPAAQPAPGGQQP